MQLKDQFDLDYTATELDTVNRFADAIESYLGHRSDVMPILESVLSMEALPMALIMRGYLLKLAGDPRFAGAVSAIVEQLSDLALNDREKKHLQVLATLAANGDAVTPIEALLKQYPHDVLACRVAHYLHFYYSGPTAMRDSMQSVLEHWQNDDPYYGYLAGMYSFGLEEAGDYEEAEQYGRMAIDYHRQDIWAAHAVAHVFQMQERFDDGIPWIDRLSPLWNDTNNFRFHLYWHNALFHIGAGAPEHALKIYDDSLVGSLKDDFYLDVCNAAALLWRLKMLGLDIGDRFQQLHDLSRARVTDDELIFSTLHYLMAPAELGDKEAVERCLASIKAWSQTQTPQGDVCRRVGLPLAQAIVDLSNQRFAEASSALSDLADDIYDIGGSDAQRALFTEMQAYAEAQSQA